MNRQIEPIQNLLSEVQGYISREYPAALSGRDDHGQLLRSYIEKYLRQNAAAPDGVSFSETVDYLYREMAEFSILTPYLRREDVEEINVNSWDDVSVSYTDGHKDKLAQGFLSPTHACDVIRRLLRQSNTIIDNAVPKAEGRLPNNSRIAAMIPPITDPDSGASAAIRLLHPSKITRDEIIASGEANDEMMDFLCLCIRYGVSFLIAGITGSGKTTLLNALLKTLPDEKRIFTIESGSREFALIRRGSDDRVSNNVVHTLSRPSDKPEYNISQEILVETSLRFSPDVIAVGEVRSVEAYSAVEAALTGHTVVSTIHSLAADAAHMRLALLCQKKFPIEFQMSLLQAAQAFPVVVYAHKLGSSRKIMDISECITAADGRRDYRTLYRYVIEDNRVRDGKVRSLGHFERVNAPSDRLIGRWMRFGAASADFERFTRPISKERME